MKKSNLINHFTFYALSLVISNSFSFSSSVEAKTVTILSIDGGGSRGIIPAIVLRTLETRVGLPTARMFDEVAGTSTGALLGGGLSVGDINGNPRYTAAELVELYETEGNKIFTRSKWDFTSWLDGIFTDRYRPSGLETLLTEKFGNVTLGNMLTDLTITSFDIGHAIPYYFSSQKAQNNSNYNFYMRDVVRATSAAPTYFTPAHIFSLADKEHVAPLEMVDGGIVMNNPALLAYTTAKRAHPDADDFLLVSLGTGDTRASINPKKGALGWVAPLIDMMMDGSSMTVHQMLEEIFPFQSGKKQQYFRLQIDLPQELWEMDRADSEMMDGLKKVADRLLKLYSSQIDQIVEELSRIKGHLRGIVENTPTS